MSLGGVPDKNLVKLFRTDQLRRGLRASTIRVRHLMLTRAAVELPNGLAGAVREDVELWLDALSLSSRSRNAYLSCFRSFYAWAIDNELLEADPTARIIRPKLPRSLPRPIPHADLGRALAGADQTMRCWLLLGAYGGLRCIEMAGLDREDVLEDEGALRITCGKGGRERMIPLHPEVLRAFQALPMPVRGPLFRRPHGKDRYPAWAVSQAINEYLHSLGVKSTAHSLRHWFGSQAYQGSGGDIRITQELLGHASPATTAIYTAFDRTGATAVVRALKIPLPLPEVVEDTPA